MEEPKYILGIETSCDETAAAIVERKNSRVKLLSNIISSSASLQEKFGGIIPEQAAREQQKAIIPVITEALEIAKIQPDQLSAIAVTQGPGLIGSLLIGVETAKVLASVWEKPLIPVNHLIGHFYANWIDQNNNPTPQFPLIGLLVSGGHSDLVLFTDHNTYTYLGGTRDDAAGECFDKCARLLGFPYPGGPKISKLAEVGDPKAYPFPRPLHDSKDLDFSFSGLKTSFANFIHQEFPAEKRHQEYGWKEINTQAIDPQKLANICASLQQAIIDSLVIKTVRSIQKTNIEQVIIAGGVAANNELILQLRGHLAEISPSIRLSVPPPILCTDNAAMIAAAAFFQEPKEPLAIQANPNLSLTS